MEFETARLIVRRIGRGDAGFMLALLNDPGFLANIGDRGVRTIEQAETYIRDRVLAVYPRGLGMLLVSRKTDGAAVGTVGFVRRDGLDHPDLGFVYLAAQCGRGYGSEAARGLLDHAPAMRPLLAITRPDNAASGAVLRKLGFVECAMVTLPGHDGPSRLFRLGPGITGLRIRDYDDGLAGDFHRINAQWISSMFTMEENDRRILDDPRGTIVDRGGVVCFVEAAGLGVVGTCALIRIDDGVFELTKMGVLERARGRKAGEYLLRHMIARAEAMGVEKLYLLTNRECASAIHLYEKAGFVHDAGIMRDHGARYERCDVAMRYPLR